MNDIIDNKIIESLGDFSQDILFDQAYLIKKAKIIRKENVLCRKGNNLITVIGDLNNLYLPKRKKPSKRFPNKFGFR